MALGAQPSEILHTVFAANVPSISAGVVAGLILALTLNGMVERWVGGSSREPLTLIGVPPLLCFVSCVACAAPAFRAMSISPMSALRFD